MQYQGDCKEGLADGFGKARGVDEYEGEFKKGLPHGQGAMKYKDGSFYEGGWKKGKRNGEGVYKKTDGSNTITNEGIWKSDRFLGKKKEISYKVLSTNGISNYSIRKIDDKVNRVTIGVKVNALKIRIPNGVEGNSGLYNVIYEDGVFENIICPFECSLNYTLENSDNRGSTRVQMLFIILEPGNWVVELNHNI
ncbi:hypothetical protein [Snuella lapsa]|uniref:Uncharacterized protein n=1 Tax=Snuella lapsa TaxID=870481 RepID=A0ABP6XXZ1_9FLAO